MIGRDVHGEIIRAEGKEGTISSGDEISTYSKTPSTVYSVL